MAHIRKTEKPHHNPIQEEISEDSSVEPVGPKEGPGLERNRDNTKVEVD